MSTEFRGWIGQDGNKLPFQTREEIENYLRTAKVIKLENIPVGVTDPRRAVLEKDGIQMRAIFRDVRIAKPSRPGLPKGLSTDFRDDSIFECAAYELSLLLGLDNVPPTVQRKIKGKNGTLQAWVEHAMTERERVKQKLNPPNGRLWLFQYQLVHLFDNLIYNDDRNQGNLLITPDWKLWMIDATRAFRVHRDLKKPELLRYCEKGAWERLQKLDEEVLKQKLSDYLRPTQIKSLLQRRDKIVERLQRLMDERGEETVLFEF